MKNEIQAIISSIQESLSGNPWYGKSVTAILSEVDTSKVYQKPNEASHSMIELLYHMVTWVEFTQHRLEKNQNVDVTEQLDWRETNPDIHTWNNGISEFNAGISSVIELLNRSSDQMLEEKVDFREYNFRHLLNGLIQHNIYHLGQMAYLNKLLS